MINNIFKRERREMALHHSCLSLNEFASLQVYKHTILPLIDYCRFLAMSGNKNGYIPLKILQNDVLRACVGYPQGYNMSRIELHKRVNLSSVYGINNFY